MVSMQNLNIGFEEATIGKLAIYASSGRVDP